jgi:hypothetical protein
MQSNYSITSNVSHCSTHLISTQHVCKHNVSLNLNKWEFLGRNNLPTLPMAMIAIVTLAKVCT